jgi:hypothetical protein
VRAYVTCSGASLLGMFHPYISSSGTPNLCSSGERILHKRPSVREAQMGLHILNIALSSSLSNLLSQDQHLNYPNAKSSHFPVQCVSERETMLIGIVARPCRFCDTQQKKESRNLSLTSKPRPSHDVACQLLGTRIYNKN